MNEAAAQKEQWNEYPTLSTRLVGNVSGTEFFSTGEARFEQRRECINEYITD